VYLPLDIPPVLRQLELLRLLLLLLGELPG